MRRAALIEREARRRAAEGGFDPDMRADRLSSCDGSGDAPIWSMYAPVVETEIALLEAAGFTVLPAHDGDTFAVLFDSVLGRLGRLMGLG